MPAVFEAAKQQFLGEWPLHVFLDDARHRTCSHLWVVAAVGDPLAGLVVEFQRHGVVAQFRLEFHDQLVHDAQDRVVFERRELDDRVEPVTEFGRE